MTPQAVRTLAQSDPLPNLATNLGTTLQAAKSRVAALVSVLRELDILKDLLLEHGLDMDIDLGPVGNAAASVRRDLEKQKPHTFEMPKAS
jgi:hypothetical protein